MDSSLHTAHNERVKLGEHVGPDLPVSPSLSVKANKMSHASSINLWDDFHLAGLRQTGCVMSTGLARAVCSVIALRLIDMI